MLLSELEILRRLCLQDPAQRLVITPMIDVKQQMQPTSVDLRLGTEFRTIRSARFPYLNLLRERHAAMAELAEYVEEIRIASWDSFVLHPGEFALGCTLEYLKLPRDLAGRLEGKSTWGRTGLQVHSTAGFVDPGFEGALTFELQNVGKVPIPLRPGLRVAQICFFAARWTTLPYTQKTSASYAGSAGVLGSRYFNMVELDRIREMLAARQSAHAEPATSDVQVATSSNEPRGGP